MKPRRYVRYVSPYERLWLVLHEIHHCQFGCVLVGSGTFDVAEFRAAADRAAAANPGIRVRHRGFLGFSRWVDSGIPPDVKLLPPSDWDGKSERGADFLKERLDPLGGGPIARILIVPCLDGKTRFVFQVLHAATDGRGLDRWVEDVFRAMRGDPLIGSSTRLRDVEVKAKHRESVVDPVGAKPNDCIPVMTPGDTGRDEISYVWRAATINRAVPQFLPKAAIFLGEWARRFATGEVVFVIPIDYRGLRTEVDGIGNLTGSVNLPVLAEDTPRTIMQRLNQEIRQFADCRSPARIWVLSWIPVRYLSRKLKPLAPHILYGGNRRIPAGTLVSMGKRSPEILNFPGFSFDRLFPMPVPGNKFTIIFIQAQNSIEIMFSVPSAYNDSGQLDQLVQAFSQHFSTASRADQQLEFAGSGAVSTKPSAESMGL